RNASASRCAGRTDEDPRLRKYVRVARSGLHEILELLVESRQAAATVDEVLLPARPGGMRGRIDVERQLGIGLAKGGARPVGRAIVQHNVDEMIVRMDALLHGHCLWLKEAGLIGDGSRNRKFRERAEGQADTHFMLAHAHEIAIGMTSRVAKPIFTKKPAQV